MHTIIKMRHGNELSLPEAFAAEDVRFSDALARYCIAQFSKPGDIVFDPFAGFGTTLYWAEKLGRSGYGIEFLPARAAYIRSIIRSKENIRCADMLKQPELPMMDLSLTSPPYMNRSDHPQYPFSGYTVTGKGYTDYLTDIQRIYRWMKLHMKPNAYALIEVSNIRWNGILTPLAWDIAKAVGEVLTLEQEIILDWQEPGLKEAAYGFGYDHSYCLIFRNTTQENAR